MGPNEMRSQAEHSSRMGLNGINQAEYIVRLILYGINFSLPLLWSWDGGERHRSGRFMEIPAD
jgi:hypothetical protein